LGLDAIIGLLLIPGREAPASRPGCGGATYWCAASGYFFQLSYHL